MLKSFPETLEIDKKIEALEIKKKSEGKAFLLSLFFPGAGTLYGGDWVVFIIMFLINAFIIFLFLRIGFWRTIFWGLSYYLVGNDNYAFTTVIGFYFFNLWHAGHTVERYNFSIRMEIEDFERKRTGILMEKYRKEKYGQNN